MKFRCSVCGYIYEGDAPPAYCPQCKARRDYELRQARNWFSVYFIPVIPLNQIGELVTCCTWTLIDPSSHLR